MNKKSSWLKKLYLRAVPQTRTNKKASLPTKLYRRSIPRTRKNQKASSSMIVIQRKTNENALLTNKNMQIMRLHIMCRAILAPLTYSNVEESFWTCLKFHMKESEWPLKENNTLRRSCILYLTIIIVRAHHFPGKILKSS